MVDCAGNKLRPELIIHNYSEELVVSLIGQSHINEKESLVQKIKIREQDSDDESSEEIK